eukprot:CAMPEP_0206257520 /NCGR_PEP_ID=MMETSP0047_2-20121206/25385_1 /ASSEMBLY_ACC=CAM_ASM_000192 /TAXON_ID=195065 /ORGANISM="Chroomonas mesostigmatica_cf, Strain CCMP1168" /LENGTH=32 /DNA_ID= /DNA_START= /DNA_END= /DNA_ORIENTATION=
MAGEGFEAVLKVDEGVLGIVGGGSFSAKSASS